MNKQIAYLMTFVFLIGMVSAAPIVNTTEADGLVNVTFYLDNEYNHNIKAYGVSYLFNSSELEIVSQTSYGLFDSFTEKFVIDGIFPSTSEVHFSQALVNGNLYNGSGYLGEFIFKRLTNGSITITPHEKGILEYSGYGITTNYTFDITIPAYIESVEPIQTPDVNIVKDELNNKTTVTFTESSKVIQVFNVDVIDAEDKIGVENKIEFKLEGNGTEEVKIDLTAFGEPKKVFVDGAEVGFTFVDNKFLVFTTHFSQRDITIDYNEPEQESESSSSGSSSSSSSSSSNTNNECNGIWNCSVWSECINEIQTRICERPTGCHSDSLKPNEEQYCELIKEDEPDTIQIIPKEEEEVEKSILPSLLVGMGCLVMVFLVLYYLTKPKYEEVEENEEQEE